MNATENPKYDWQRLNHLQVGRYAEYLVKMELTLWGLDVYTSEVDDRGIDFVVKLNDTAYVDIQVKSVRTPVYVFFPKGEKGAEKFSLRPNLFAALVILLPLQPPDMYLIPATAWLTPDALLVDRDYETAKSKPEFGLNLSQKNLFLLARFRFDDMVQKLGWVASS